ncbi:MAG TPA: hypothetical protein VHQ47_17960 [Phycisphaerae bacterium]|nr:hypothetical protein [Phycisphaerae bacterium]
MKTETCENCGRTIGKLETPRVWQEHIVCGTCHRHLTGTAVVPAASVTPSPLEKPPPPPHVLMVAAERHRPHVQTIEATGKRWKGMQAFGSLAIVAGLVLGVMGFTGSGPEFTGFGLLLLVAGVGVTVVARLGAWWYHG